LGNYDDEVYLNEGYHFLTLNNCSKDRENERADNDPPELHMLPILDEFWFHAYITTHLRLRSSVPKGFVEFTNLLKQRKNLQAKLKTAKTAMTK
ncbi:Glycine dehydrogenase (decarboxylating), partial [Trichinella spiralis]